MQIAGSCRLHTAADGNIERRRAVHGPELLCSNIPSHDTLFPHLNPLTGLGSVSVSAKLEFRER